MNSLAMNSFMSKRVNYSSFRPTYQNFVLKNRIEFNRIKAPAIFYTSLRYKTDSFSEESESSEKVIELPGRGAEPEKKKKYEEKLASKYIQKLKANKRKELLEKRMGIETKVVMPQFATAKILSNLFGVRVVDVLKVLIKLDLEPESPDDPIDQNLADIIAEEFYFTPVRREIYDEINPNKISIDIRSRPPIVTVMGHVDHGKTTLLDALRSSSRAAEEAGGITQHISAFEVAFGDYKATFIDTPGHAAFSEMRKRGSQIADIVILVIASDDGIKVQTEEILNQLEIEKIPFIVAITKIDKDNSHPEQIYKQLNSRGFRVEQLGGDIQCVHIAAKKGVGLSELVEAINIQAEYINIECDYSGKGEGAILEAKKDKRKGYSATVIIHAGQMKLGATYVSGFLKGKIRSIYDGFGRSLTAAGPSKVVEITGFKDQVPIPGADFIIVENEDQANQLIQFRLQKKTLEEKVVEEMKLLEVEKKKKEIIEMVMEDSSQVDLLLADDKKKKSVDTTKYVNILLKSDVPGSISALLEAISIIPSDQHNIVIDTVYTGIGDVTENDIARAKTTKSSLICFNVSCPPNIALFARTENIQLFQSKVIYNVVNHIAQQVENLLPPKIIVDVVGRATIKKVYKLHTKDKSTVAGCYVDFGIIARKHKVRLLRNEEILIEGKLESLRNYKEDTKEVKSTMECGLRISGWNDFQEGDIIECYTTRSIPGRLDFHQSQKNIEGDGSH